MNNPYLDQNYAPIAHESTVSELAVTGSIPRSLNGRYLRNGPNPRADVDPGTYNWFAGDGMVHGVRLRNGSAEWYRSRTVRSASGSKRPNAAAQKRRHRAGSGALGANTNVIAHAGRTLALVEGGVAVQELTDELETIGPCDFGGTLRGGYTGHPKRDPKTGELHGVSYCFGRGNRVQYSVIGCDGRARRTVDIEVTGSPMMHDFSLTERHVVFYDLPVTFDVPRAVELAVPQLFRGVAQWALGAAAGRLRFPQPIRAAMTGRALGTAALPYRWNPSYAARVGVMPRDGSSHDVRWFEVEPCYVFHPLNAYDDGDSIVIDLVRHEKVFDTDLIGPDETPPTLDRWTIDLCAGQVREVRLEDRPQEFPRLDERRTGLRHRYGYTIALESSYGCPPSDTLLKHDLQTGRTSTRSFGAGKQVGEFVFEPSSASAAEDDGVLMGFVYDRADARSNLILLDAGTLDTVASIHLPTRVPVGFHGNWIPS